MTKSRVLKKCSTHCEEFTSHEFYALHGIKMYDTVRICLVVCEIKLGPSRNETHKHLHAKIAIYICHSYTPKNYIIWIYLKAM